MNDNSFIGRLRDLKYSQLLGDKDTPEEREHIAQEEALGLQRVEQIDFGNIVSESNSERPAVIETSTDKEDPATDYHNPGSDSDQQTASTKRPGRKKDLHSWDGIRNYSAMLRTVEEYLRENINADSQAAMQAASDIRNKNQDPFLGDLIMAAYEELCRNVPG